MLGLINETIAKNIPNHLKKQPIHLRFREIAKRKNRASEILKKNFRCVLLENKCWHIFAPALVERGIDS